MQVPEAGSYSFVELLADAPPFRRYRAFDTVSRKFVLVKQVEIPDNGEDKSRSALLQSAAGWQKSIRSGPILTPVDVFHRDGYLTTVYPFLDAEIWQPLSSRILTEHLPDVLASIALSVDLLHLLGFVHSDLKLQNFMVSGHGNSMKTLLVDLDFLLPIGSKLHGLIVGSPGHIAPEVLANDCIVPQSDMYSLGTSLQIDLLSKDSSDSMSSEFRSRLEDLVESMTTSNWALRPPFLINALAQNGMLSATAITRLNKQLLSLYALNKLDNKTRQLIRQGGHDQFVCSTLRLGGLPVELMSASRLAACQRLHHVFQVWRNHLASSEIVRHGEFFAVRLPDQQLEQMLLTFDVQEGSQLDGSSDPTSPDCVLKCGEELLKNQQPFRALCMIRKCLASAEQSAVIPSELVQLNKSAGDCNTRLARFPEAAEHFEIAASITGPTLALLLEAAINRIRAGHFTQAENLIDQARALPGFQDDCFLALRLARLEAHCAMVAGRLSEAESLLMYISKTAEAHSDHELSQIVEYQQGILAWRRGDYTRAVEHYQSAAQTDDKGGSPAASIQALAALAALCCDIGEYLQAQLHGKAARHAASRSIQLSALPGIDMAMCYSSARLAKKRRARYWLQKYLEDCQQGWGGTSLTGYYVLASFVALQEGRIAEAKFSLGHAWSLLGANTRTSHAIKILLNLAELHLWGGDERESQQCALDCMTIARELDDAVSISEARLIYSLATAEPDRVAVTELEEIGIALVMKRSSYRAALCAFYLQYVASELPSSLALFVSGLRKNRNSKHVPLFAALLHLDPLSHQTGSSQSALASKWRSAYHVLAKGDQHYLAALCAIRVADEYTERTLPKHAEKFLNRAVQHALIIGNEKLGSAATARLEKVKRLSNERMGLVHSLRSVSCLMRDLKDYPATLNQLVQFAVEQVGAERGVLLLSNVDDGGMQAIASYNCDNDAAAEIAEISLSISKATVDESLAVFVDNAQNDLRTNHYQSVLVHNILSVASIPLQRNGKAIGALYLDHHSLPALFGEDDRRLMEAIANLIVVTLSATKDIRGLTLHADYLSHELKRLGVGSSLITRDPTMLKLLGKLPQIAESNSTVLLYGETGTGKDIFCDMIHQLSNRANEALIKLNCAALTPTLVESELFGIARAVATGVAQRPGRFEAADGGTLFLDEIAELPIDVQAKILRAVENRQIERVGSYRSMAVDVRLILATHQDLDQMVAEHRFRADLYHRITTVTIEIPPLRDRRCDIPLLVEHFLMVFAAGRRPPQLTQATYNTLVAHPWPGNVRQLRSVIEYCCVFHPGETVTPDLLPPKLTHALHAQSHPPQFVESAERERIINALRQNRGNRAKTADFLGIHISALRRRLKKYSLE